MTVTRYLNGDQYTGELSGDERFGSGTQLLRLNDEARFEHGWQAVLDADDSLCISVLISMASTSAEDLAGSLDDGMYRAGLLSEVLRGLLSDGPRDPAQATASVTSGMVRG
jgi:hypothetical protein